MFTENAGEMETPYKAGFVTIVGKPNVGKSTLMNHLIGQKIAITSYKPQTTRTTIRTIYTSEKGQIVFLDTPGVHKATTKLGKYMDKAVESTLKEVDLILWLVEPKEQISEEDRMVLALLAKAKAKKLIVITKMDTVKKAQLLPVMDLYAREWKKCTGENAPEMIPVSAQTGMNLDEVRSLIYAALPEGEPFYDEDMVTTQTEREITEEIVREKALRLLQEEVPHGIAVTVNTMKWRKSKSGDEICDIDADIVCEKDSHKAIIIGKGGSTLKKIGSAARVDIEEMIGTRVNLKLFVKVRRDWKDSEGSIRTFGYDEKKL